MEIVFSEDSHSMNWLRPDFPYAEVRLPSPVHGASITAGLEASVTTERHGELTHTRVTLTNTSGKPFFSKTGDISITFPLEDRYDGRGGEQQTRRCNAHIFCGGTSSFVLAKRTGGRAPHLGMVLTEGSLSSYSIERDTELESNDRGCFLLHPTPFVLEPGEQIAVAWTIFPCESTEDFFREAGRHARFVQVDWSQYVLWRGETSELVVRPSFGCQSVTADGRELRPFGDGTYRMTLTADEVGEREIVVRAAEQIVRTRILIKDPLDGLLERRCLFIAENQQYHGRIERLRGAYLIYDNESRRIYYNQLNDYNAGRERIGMGVLMATYLLSIRSGLVSPTEESVVTRVRESLGSFASYVQRELVDEATGETHNDAGDGSFFRLYNAPWYAIFYLMLYQLHGETGDLLVALRIIERFYEDGGERFYPIELPILELCRSLERAGLREELDRVMPLFQRHAEFIARTGNDFPPSEVNYEQSMVAPAADILLQVYMLTGDEPLLEAAREQIRILEQFQGPQPDYHLHDVAVRHWDGFWFGKRRMYGDTFPHYWSALTGNVYALRAQIIEDEDSAHRAEQILRGVLPLIFDDGSASCAYLFPYSVNGERAEYYDPYANDQDWGLTFYVRWLAATTQGAPVR